MIDQEDEDITPLASPPCFMHEIVAGYGGSCIPVEHQQNVDVARWRKAERARLIAARLSMPEEVRRRLSERIGEQLEQRIGDVRGLIVSAYWPIRGEPDLRDLMRRIVFGGGRMALPVVVARARPLVFREWKPGAKLERGIGNIPVPTDGAELIPDIVIAPVVAFDTARYRLGYGGGFLDRTLASVIKRPRVYGVGFSAAAVPTIFPQPYDIPMDAIVTERGDVPFGAEG